MQDGFAHSVFLNGVITSFGDNFEKIGTTMC